MKKLWKFEWPLDRSFMGGLFKATDEQVQSLDGKKINLSGWKGNHSDICVNIEDCEILLVSDNPIIVDTTGCIGFNPLDFIEE